MNKMTDRQATDGEAKSSVSDDTFVSLRDGFARMPKPALSDYTARLELNCRELRRDNGALRELTEQAKATAGKATEAQKLAEAQRETQRHRADAAERDRENLRKELETVRAERDRAAGYIDRILEDDAVREGESGRAIIPPTNVYSSAEIRHHRRGPRFGDKDIPF